MSTVIANTPASHGYLDSAGRALMNFVGKMLAFAPFAHATSHGSAGRAAMLKEREAILRLAKQFDAMSPSQAAELRYLAGRD